MKKKNKLLALIICVPIVISILILPLCSWTSILSGNDLVLYRSSFGTSFFVGASCYNSGTKYDTLIVNPNFIIADSQGNFYDVFSDYMDGTIGCYVIDSNFDDPNYDVVHEMYSSDGFSASYINGYFAFDLFNGGVPINWFMMLDQDGSTITHDDLFIESFSMVYLSGDAIYEYSIPPNAHLTLYDITSDDYNPNIYVYDIIFGFINYAQIDGSVLYFDIKFSYNFQTIYTDVFGGVNFSSYLMPNNTVVDASGHVSNSYDSGYDDGYNDGYDYGLEEGYDAGYEAGEEYFFADGYAYGYDAGLEDGYQNGFYDGEQSGYHEGYDIGYDDGYHKGVDDAPTKWSGIMDIFIHLLTGFTETEIFPGFSIGGVLAIFVGGLLLIAFLKLFAGG